PRLDAESAATIGSSGKIVLRDSTVSMPSPARMTSPPLPKRTPNPSCRPSALNAGDTSSRVGDGGQQRRSLVLHGAVAIVAGRVKAQGRTRTEVGDTP